MRDREKESLKVKETEGRQRREKGKRRQREFGKFYVYQTKDVPSCVFHSLCRIYSPRRSRTCYTLLPCLCVTVLCCRMCVGHCAFVQVGGT